MTESSRLRPLETFDAGAITGLFTDIDDTLTRGGKLPATVYTMLERLAAAGIAIVPVTGRSAGWAHLILHHWPVHAVVAESGGILIHRDARGRPCWLWHDTPERVAADRARIETLAAQVLRETPTLAPANDNAFRLVDVAIDHCETLASPAPPADIARAIARFEAAGFRARASSVHINVWHGDFDKAPMALRYLAEIRGETDAAAADRWAFVGDAPNDESMFAAFGHSVAVANLLPHRDALAALPAYVTRASHGEGFVELAAHLLAARAARRA
ncbi:MAG: HAD family hydrolase [Lautropia sp.]